MKKIPLLFVFFLISCATAYTNKPMLDQGVACAKMNPENKKEENCIFTDTYVDRTRWHFLRPWEEGSYGLMP